MFDAQRFVEDCRALQRKGDGQPAIHELMQEALQNPAGIIRALGEPKRAGVYPLYKGPDLTVLNLWWGPHMTVPPHNHSMWAVIGIYSGREDNMFWRRLADDPRGRVEAAGARALSTKDCVPLGRDIIHSVLNPIPRLTGAIHVYGGDFFTAARKEWDSETLCEGVYNSENTVRLFEESNNRLPAA